MIFEPLRPYLRRIFRWSLRCRSMFKRRDQRLRFLSLLAAQVEGAGFYKIFSFIAVTSYSGTFCSLHFVGCACSPLYFCFLPVCFSRFVRLLFLFVRVFVDSSVSSFVCFLVWLFISLLVCLSLGCFVCLYVCLFVCLFLSSFVCLFVCLFGILLVWSFVRSVLLWRFRLN